MLLWILHEEKEHYDSFAFTDDKWKHGSQRYHHDDKLFQVSTMWFFKFSGHNFHLLKFNCEISTCMWTEMLRVRSNMQIINDFFGLNLWFWGHSVWFVFRSLAWVTYKKFQKDFVQWKSNSQGQVSPVLVLRPLFSMLVIKYSCLRTTQSPQTFESFDLILQMFITIFLLTSLLFSILCNTYCSKHSRKSILGETVHLLTHEDMVYLAGNCNIPKSPFKSAWE